MDWLSAALSLLDKFTPSRREDAVNAIHQLEEYHGKALAENRMVLAAQIRKKIKQIKEAYEDI